MEPDLGKDLSIAVARELLQGQKVIILSALDRLPRIDAGSGPQEEATERPSPGRRGLRTVSARSRPKEKAKMPILVLKSDKNDWLVDCVDFAVLSFA
jgi:hypothetical protein